MTAVLEVTLAWLFKNAKGRDEKSFHKGPAFADFTEPTIIVTSPELGETNAEIPKEFTADGHGRMPSIEWFVPPGLASKLKEWLVVIEDPDVPLPSPVAHALYGGIAPEITRIEAKDLEIENDDEALLKGGFHYGKNLRSKVYVPPRPLMNHGPHRYFFQIIALSDTLDKNMLQGKATKDQLSAAIKGKVLGWGMWVGSCERTWS